MVSTLGEPVVSTLGEPAVSTLENQQLCLQVLHLESLNNLLILNPVSAGATFRVFYTAAQDEHVNNLLILNLVYADATFRVS